jgi:zinc transport system substrate-binding protein
MQRYNLCQTMAMAALAALLITLLAVGGAGVAAAQPAVVASIKPVHSLVAGVMEGVGEPTLLLRGGASPHAYALRPSDAQALARAQVVFWIGEGFETFLIRSLGTLAAGTRVVELAEAEDVALLPNREGGMWEEEAEEAPERSIHSRRRTEAPRAEEEHGHEHGEYNLHIWLAPANAQAMVRAIVAALAEADPARAERYRANGQRLHQRLEALDAALRRRLAPVAGRPYIVFHDAYANLEQAYGLNAVGSITVSPEQAPGARRIAQLRAKVQALGAVCVFAEPQFEPRLVRTVVDGTPARVGVLDPLGADLPDGPGLYFALLERMAEALVGCLAGS